MDEQGNLVDTEGRIQFLPEGPIPNYVGGLGTLRGTTLLSPGTSPGFVQESLFPVKSFRSLNTGFADRNSNIYYKKDRENLGLFPGADNNIGLPGTADDVFPFEPPGTADDRIANLIGVSGTADDVFPFAPKNRLGGLDLNRFEGIGTLGVANEEDVEQEFLPGQKKSSGIADLFKTLIGFAIPGGNFLLNTGRGIRSLNQRLRNTDFGRSKNLMDFLDMKKYGGYQGREDARRKTIEDAARITSGLKRTADDNVIDRGRGQMPSRTTSASKPSRSSGFSSSARGRALHG